MTQFSLSLVLPVTNVVASLAAIIAECQTVAAAHTPDYEIILADDASSDGTGELADRLAAIHTPVAVIHYPHRRGYRQALYDAWGVARGTYVVALALAGPATVADIARLLPAAPDHAAIFGYRVPSPRHPAERLFAALAKLRVAPGMHDPLLGLGLFRNDLRDLLPPNGPDALTHAELYAAVRQQHHKIAQIAVPSHAETAARGTFGATGAALGQRGSVVGAGVLIAAGSLWLRYRWRRHS